MCATDKKHWRCWYGHLARVILDIKHGHSVCAKHNSSKRDLTLTRLRDKLEADRIDMLIDDILNG